MKEQYIELETKYGTMRGMLHAPEDTSKKYPILVMCHGFTGNRIDANFIFVRFAREASKNNIGVLRLDFIGSGESDGSFSDMTFLREEDQAREVVKLAKSFKWADKVYLMGFSMGGAIAARVASKLNNSIDKLLLWSPAGNMKEMAINIFDNGRLLGNGNIDLSGLELSRDFLEELKSFDLYDGVCKYKGESCVIHGGNDQGVPKNYGEKYNKIFNGEFHIIENADHVYSGLAFRKELFNYSIEFLKK